MSTCGGSLQVTVRKQMLGAGSGRTAVLSLVAREEGVAHRDADSSRSSWPSCRASRRLGSEGGCSPTPNSGGRGWVLGVGGEGGQQVLGQGLGPQPLWVPPLPLRAEPIHACGEAFAFAQHALS